MNHLYNLTSFSVSGGHLLFWTSGQNLFRQSHSREDEELSTFFTKKDSLSSFLVLTGVYSKHPCHPPPGVMQGDSACRLNNNLQRSFEQQQLTKVVWTTTTYKGRLNNNLQTWNASAGLASMWLIGSEKSSSVSIRSSGSTDFFPFDLDMEGFFLELAGFC